MSIFHKAVRYALNETMSKVSVSDSNTSLLTADKRNRYLILENAGSNEAKIGFSDGENTLSFSGSTQGVSLKVGEKVIFDGPPAQSGWEAICDTSLSTNIIVIKG